MSSWVQARYFPLTSILGTVIVAGGSVALYKWFWKNRRPLATGPKGEWKFVGIVADPVCIYPIKSGKALPMTSAKATEIGLREIGTEEKRFSRGDRLFVIYDPKTNEKMTARTYPKMMSLQLSVVADSEIELFSNLNEDLGFVRVKVPSGPVDTFVEMWNKEEIPGIDCGDEAARWVSLFVREKPDSLRLAYFPENQRRRLTQYFKKFLKVFPYITDKAGGAFSDLSAFLVVNAASVQDLNSRLTESDRVTAANFRPNIIVDGAEPYAEDKWSWLKIGEDVILKVVSPSTRCSMTTINPVTLERNLKREPLKTLQTFRLCKTQDQRELYGDSPMMGVNCSNYARGIVKVGDPVYVAE